jgi:hypothetical protein
VQSLLAMCELSSGLTALLVKDSINLYPKKDESEKQYKSERTEKQYDATQNIRAFFSCARKYGDWLESGIDKIVYCSTIFFPSSVVYTR